MVRAAQIAGRDQIKPDRNATGPGAAAVADFARGRLAFWQANRACPNVSLAVTGRTRFHWACL